MLSSFSRYRQHHSSSSSLENDSKSDQSEEEGSGHNLISIGHYHQTRTNKIDKNMLERPSDSDDSCSESDITDNDKDNDDSQFTTTSTHSASRFLTRQLTLYENDWPRKSSNDENKFKKSIHREDMALLTDARQDTAFIASSNQYRLFSAERSKLVGSVDAKYHLRNNSYTSLTNDFKVNTPEHSSTSESFNTQTTTTTPAAAVASPLSQSTITTVVSPQRTSITNVEKQQTLSKMPTVIDLSIRSRSRSPTTINTTANSSSTTDSNLLFSTKSQKMPVSVPAVNKGAFRFFTAQDPPSSSSSLSMPLSASHFQAPPPSKTTTTTSDSSQISSQHAKQTSPFTPITSVKTSALLKKNASSSAGHTPSIKQSYLQLLTSDDNDEDDDSDMNHLQEADLKIILKQQKRHEKMTGELLSKLHENYEQLLEKYAQAENTIDQLRFQPRIIGDNTPPVNAPEANVQYIQQPKVQTGMVTSNGVYHPTHGTPLSSLKQAPSITSNTTTATTASAVKSSSSSNSVIVESVIFDELLAAQKIVVQQLTTPETIRLDLLIQTKTLAEKMKSFVTLMDANQLSLAEQKQVYENIKDDYEKLLHAYDQTKQNIDPNDVDFDADLNKELETMKHLIKEIVTRITDNLLGKSNQTSDTERITRQESHSSQLSTQSSICNQTDIMSQYRKLLNAADTEAGEKKPLTKPLQKEPEQMKHTYSSVVPPSTGSNRQSTKPKDRKKTYVYASGNSDDEQQQIHEIKTSPLQQKQESAISKVEDGPAKLNQYQHKINEEQIQLRGANRSTKKKKSPSKREVQEYDNLENVKRSKRKPQDDYKKPKVQCQPEKELSPASLSMPTGSTRYSLASLRTRTSDYDSGIGTNNTTKLSRDSKLNTSTIDGSNYQSLDDERRRHSEEEQVSASNISSHSSGSGTTSPSSPQRKYTKRFDRPLSSKQLYENRHRKISGNSEVHTSDFETQITNSFNSYPRTESHRRRQSHHSCQPKRSTSTHRSRLTPFHRSLSSDSVEADNLRNKSHRPQTAPQLSDNRIERRSMSKKYQTSVIHHQSKLSKHPKTIYKSSFYIEEPHTHRKSQEKLLHRDQQQHHQPKQILTRKDLSNLYLDSKTGIIYRYIQEKAPSPAKATQRTIAHAKVSSQTLYKCLECGVTTTYHHRHHIDATTSKRVTVDIDDLGYESENRKLKRYRQYIDLLASSDSDSDDNLTQSEMKVLNEAYERAKQAQAHSRDLSRYINRQLKLALAAI